MEEFKRGTALVNIGLVARSRIDLEYGYVLFDFRDRLLLIRDFREETLKAARRYLESPPKKFLYYLDELIKQVIVPAEFLFYSETAKDAPEIKVTRHCLELFDNKQKLIPNFYFRIVYSQQQTPSDCFEMGIREWYGEDLDEDGDEFKLIKEITERVSERDFGKEFFKTLTGEEIASVHLVGPPSEELLKATEEFCSHYKSRH